MKKNIDICELTVEDIENMNAYELRNVLKEIKTHKINCLKDTIMAVLSSIIVIFLTMIIIPEFISFIPFDVMYATSITLLCIYTYGIIKEYDILVDIDKNISKKLIQQKLEEKVNSSKESIQLRRNNKLIQENNKESINKSNDFSYKYNPTKYNYLRDSQELEKKLSKVKLKKLEKSDKNEICK